MSTAMEMNWPGWKDDREPTCYFEHSQMKGKELAFTFVCGTGDGARASCMLGKLSATEPQPKALDF
jgi:hypothetical protein